ncbi:MAG: hypothetical protein LRY26_00065 [Bacilli bacterium]|nr:hypothetical protein [Bacilli bacterium]
MIKNLNIKKVLLKTALVASITLVGGHRVVEMVDNHLTQERLEDFDSFSTLEIANLNTWLQDPEFAKLYAEVKELAFLHAPMSDEMVEQTYNEIMSWRRDLIDFQRLNPSINVDEYGFRSLFTEYPKIVKEADFGKNISIANYERTEKQEVYVFEVNPDYDYKSEKGQTFIIFKEEFGKDVSNEQKVRNHMFRYFTFTRVLSDRGVDFRPLEIKSEVDIYTR